MKFLLGVSWISAFLLSSPNLIPAKDYSLDLRSEWGILHRAGCLDGFDMVHDLFRQVTLILRFFIFGWWIFIAFEAKCEFAPIGYSHSIGPLHALLFRPY